MDWLDAVIVPPTKDLGGGFQVRRALPSIERRMVGPFVFFDQMGPEVLGAGRGLDVRPHPHIGLATVTYVFEGEILHRDSLGSVQPIRPGDVNWMSAGHGIVHSERTPPELRSVDTSLFGIQAWVALPHEKEESEPYFFHHPGAELPIIEGKGVKVRILAGALFGAKAPVRTESELFYADAQLDLDAELAIPASYEERAIYVATGSMEVRADGSRFEAGQLVVLKPDVAVVVHAAAPSTRLMLLGGPPLDGPRTVWWNFVSSSRDRIERAKEDWTRRRMPKVPGDEDEWIPIPGTGSTNVRYP